jgi:hypothetical protein
MKILALDFDGVLHSYTSGWQADGSIPDKPVEGAIEFLFEAVKRFEVHIYSSRSSQPGGIEAMQKWLKRKAETWALIKGKYQEAAEVLAAIRWPTAKPPAHLTIDDRAWTFNGTWPSLDDIEAFKPWNRKPAGATTQAFPLEVRGDAEDCEEPDEGDTQLLKADERMRVVMARVVREAFEELKPLLVQRGAVHPQDFDTAGGVAVVYRVTCSLDRGEIWFRSNNCFHSEEGALAELKRQRATFAGLEPRVPLFGICVEGAPLRMHQSAPLPSAGEQAYAASCAAAGYPVWDERPPALRDTWEANATKGAPDAKD